MKIDTSCPSSLNMNKYDGLFSANIKPQTIESLAESVAEGDLQGIEILSNLALRRDGAGSKAENLLFDILTGKIHVKNYSSVINTIHNSALDLYRLSIRPAMKNNADMHKMHTASRLLYMAGPAATADERQRLSRIFTDEQSALSPAERFDDSDLWHPARMMTTDEINSAIRLCARHYDTPDINFPIGLINPYSGENILSAQIDELKRYFTFLSEPEFFPVNTGDHWIAFGLYKPAPDAAPKAIIFNSADPLPKEIKRTLADSARIAGVKVPKDILFLEKNIQTQVPNGCGLFTIEAIKLLMENNFQSPPDVLQAFLSSFPQMPAEEQALYNLQNRYSIYAETYLS